MPLNAPLTPEAFRIALHKGQGRVHQHVRQYGLEGMVDIVLDACLHDRSYDRQCEDDRDEWLWALFKNAPEYSQFADAILAALRAGGHEYWDRRLLIALGAALARAGVSGAFDILHPAVLREARRSDDYGMGARDLFACGGLPALADLARCYGRRLLNPDDRMMPLADLVEEPALLQEALSFLACKAGRDTDIHRYLRYSRKVERRKREQDRPGTQRRQQQRRLRRRQGESRQALQRILDAARNPRPDSRRLIRSQGWRLDASGKRAVLDALLVTESRESRILLLRTFSATALPELHPRLWEWMDAGDAELRDATLQALARLNDEALGEYARSHLQNAGGETASVIPLLIRNYRPGDEELVLKSLECHDGGKDELHALSMDALDILRNNDTVNPLPLLSWVYENDPCSLCRSRALALMLDYGCASREVLEECLDDADEECRERARTGIEAMDRGQLSKQP